jgi:hypothetical protein
MAITFTVNNKPASVDAGPETLHHEEAQRGAQD